MPRQIALLRGINLGARNRVSMPELRELLTGLGHEDVKTLLQSGNVVLTSDADPAGLERDLVRKLREAFGFVGTPIEVSVRVREKRRKN